ncbi:phage tail fiber protein [Proteus mirabilis]|uniref:phage tail fiber protein n=1 Tax=Proteus mirabilis TaxID=584 RepID=UPI004044BAC3
MAITSLKCNANPEGTFTTNDESEGATVTRVGQGEYLIEGLLGFNSDAGWRGIDGGIEISLDVNKQPLIWVGSEIMGDGSILVKTYHRTHPNAPEFANNKIDGFNNDDPMIFLMVVLFPFAYRCLSNQSIT